MSLFGNEDIKADNIMMELVDESVLEVFTQTEMQDPSPRKFVDGAPIYLSRQFSCPRKFGNVVLGDFGAAVRGDQKRNHDAQPNVYRSPEVMLKTEWSYPIDIWNVRVMVGLYNIQSPVPSPIRVRVVPNWDISATRSGTYLRGDTSFKETTRKRKST
jgi:hypothetical protein